MKISIETIEILANKKFEKHAFGYNVQFDLLIFSRDKDLGQ
jgi:hypothetical protein